MVPYHSLHRIHGWIKCENTWKKKKSKNKFFKQINVRPRKGKVSIHSHENQCKWHTGCYEKCVNLTNNHPRRYPPKNQCQLRNTFSHIVRIPQVNSKLDCQQNSLGTGDTPVQTFYSERERVEPSWIKYQSTGWHWGLPLPIHPVYDYIIISSLRLYLTTKLSFPIKPRNLVIFFSPHH